MASSTNKLKVKLSGLNKSLDELESLLEPLFAQTLEETTLPLDPIQQAKLQVLLPYITHDLIFVYLKTQGLDPKTHPVLSELERIKQYFEKVKEAEDPAKRTTTVDKAAASRFIKHAIAQAQTNPPFIAEDRQPEAGPSNTHIRFADEQVEREPVPVKVTEKMRERAEYERRLREEENESESDEGLAIFEDEEMEAPETEQAPVPEEQGPQVHGQGSTLSVTKKRRRAVDPFTGLASDTEGRASTPTTGREDSATPTNTSPVRKDKKKRKKSKLAVTGRED